MLLRPGYGAAFVVAAWLKLVGIERRFAAVQALVGVDLAVGSDEMLVVLGPTGAGKTTLLRTIAGLEVPDAGRIEMGGEEVTFWPPAARDVAFVFQNFALYPDWSVRRNLEFPLRAPGRQYLQQEIDERIDWAAALLRIEGLLDRPAAKLSGGEMQRVAIGRAIVRRPKLFLLDEPLTNLDAKLRESLRVELTLLRQELGLPMIYVTHDQTEALSMGDRVAVLADGRILQEGRPEDIYRRPVSPTVAKQLGQPAINIIAIRREGDFWLAEGGAPLLPATEGQGEMLLGIRPEDIDAEGGGVEGIIRVVEDAGAVSILLVDWAGVTIRITVPKGRYIAPGGKIHPLINARRAVFWPR